MSVSPEAIRNERSLEATHTAIDRAVAQILCAIPLPLALFDTADDTLSLANAAFCAEFGSGAVRRSDFEQHLDAVGPRAASADQHTQHYCANGRTYRLDWTQLQGGDGAHWLLSAQIVGESVHGRRGDCDDRQRIGGGSRVMAAGEMANTLAHEINQPLATIFNCLSAARTLLERRATNLHRLRQALNLAYEQAQQAAAVVTRIRQFARNREPRVELQCMRALVERVIQLQRVEAQKTSVRMHCVFDGELPPVQVDRIMIEQVLSNLIRNGIEAMQGSVPEQRVLTISAALNPRRHLEIRVADRGIGISEAGQARLFTPFYSTKPDGMGIGLAISRSIVEYHDGRLYFEPRPGGGSVFAFTLPLAAAS
jgi:signal transduction histidine kinase